jgi:hypothetical protein
VFVAQGRQAELDELLQWSATPAEAVEVVKDPPKLAVLVTCPWCASFWVGLAVVGCRRFAPTLWGPLARVLAGSHLAGLIANE